MNKPRILSGIQPSGKLHVGNYIGALRKFVYLQDHKENEYERFFMIADYHSITENYEPTEKSKQILELTADFLAAGLNPEKSIIFLQSLVPEHMELKWIFDTVTPVSELTRMTQYKDKASRQSKNVNSGLFTYPVLQAADILIYRAGAIPVGRDQFQHLELTNDIARRFNNKFGKDFFMPITYMASDEESGVAADRIMSLKNPQQKMSKSDPAGCLFLDDSPEEIKKKLKKAVTETSPGKEKEGALGIVNLFTLLTNFGTKDDVKKFEALRDKGTIKYSELKEILASRIADYFKDYRNKKKKLMENPETLKETLEEGSKKAHEIASKTLAEVKEKIGLKI